MGYPYFYALQPRWCSSDRFYKVFVAGDKGLICGARIAGQFYDKQSAHVQLVLPAQIFAPLMALWANRLVRKREVTEAQYESIDPTGPQFMTEHRHNFQISTMDITGTHFITRRSYWTTGNSGRMEIHLRSGEILPFILVGNDANQVSEILRPVVSKLEIREHA
jgi:hypothetical protein